MTKHCLDNKNHLSMRTPAINHTTEGQSGKAFKPNMKQLSAGNPGQPPIAFLCPPGPENCLSREHKISAGTSTERVLNTTVAEQVCFPASFSARLHPLAATSLFTMQ